MSAKNYFEFQILSALWLSRTRPPSRDTSDWEWPQAYLPKVDTNPPDTCTSTEQKLNSDLPLQTSTELQCLTVPLPVTQLLSELTQT